MKNLTFTQALEKLEAINTWFESDEFQLEQAIEKYQEAQLLLTFCQEKLSQAQTTFKDITPSHDEIP